MLGTFRLSEDEQQQRQRDALHVSRVQRLVQVRQQAKRADAERLRAYRTRLLSSQVKVEGEIREKWEEAKDARCESLRKEKRRAFGEVGKGHGSACVAVLREKANEMHAEGVRQIREEATHKRFRSAVAVVRQERVDELKAQKEADNRRKDRSALDRKRAHEFGEKWEQEQKEVKDDGCEEAIVFGGMRGVPDFSRTRLHQGEGERGVFIKQAFGDLGDEEEGNKAETDAQEEQARTTEETENNISIALEYASKAKDRGEVALLREQALRERERIEGVLEQMQHEKNKKRKEALLHGNLTNAPILRTWKSKAHQEQLQAAFEQAFVGDLSCQQPPVERNQEHSAENPISLQWNTRHVNKEALPTILEVASLASSSASIINSTEDTHVEANVNYKQCSQDICHPKSIGGVNKNLKNTINISAPEKYPGQEGTCEQFSTTSKDHCEVPPVHHVAQGVAGEERYPAAVRSMQAETVNYASCSSSTISTEQIAHVEKPHKFTDFLLSSSVSSSCLDGSDTHGVGENASQPDWLDEILEPYLDHQSASQSHSCKLEKISGSGQSSKSGVQGYAPECRATETNGHEKVIQNTTGIENLGQTSSLGKSEGQVISSQLRQENEDTACATSIPSTMPLLQVALSPKKHIAPAAVEQHNTPTALCSSSSSLGALSDALSYGTDSCIDHIQAATWKPQASPLQASSTCGRMEHGVQPKHHRYEEELLDAPNHSNLLCHLDLGSICGDTVDGDDASVTSLEIDQLLSGLGKYDGSSSSIISGISTAVADLKQGKSALSISDTLSLSDSLLDPVLSRSSIVRSACGINPRRFNALSVATSTLQTIIEDREKPKRESEFTRTTDQNGSTHLQPDGSTNPGCSIPQTAATGSGQSLVDHRCPEKSFTSVSSSVESLEALLTRLNLTDAEGRNTSDDTIGMASSINDFNTFLPTLHPLVDNSCRSDLSHPLSTSTYQSCKMHERERSTFCGPKSVTSDDTCIESLMSSISGPLSSINSETIRTFGNIVSSESKSSSSIKSS